MISCSWRSPGTIISLLLVSMPVFTSLLKVSPRGDLWLSGVEEKVSARDKDDHIDCCRNVSFCDRTEIKKKKKILTPSQVVVDYQVTRTGIGKKEHIVYLHHLLGPNLVAITS